MPSDQAMCVEDGGNYQGDGTSCDPDLCPPIKGACCLDDGMCATVEEIECAAANGAYQGDDTVCAPALCPLPDGACCLPSGECIEVTQPECQTAGGAYQGNFTICTPDLCAAPEGACCFMDGTCEVRFGPFGEDSQRYAFVAEVARRLHYGRLKRPDKGVVMRYLEHTTGYSRPQLTRLVGRAVRHL